MAKRKTYPPRPGSWRWSKETTRAVVAEFNAYADFTRVGAPRGGGRTVLVVGVDCPAVGLVCTPIPEPLVDRLADALDVGGAAFRRISLVEAASKYSHHRAVRTWWKAKRPVGVAERNHTLTAGWAEDLRLLWAVRLTIPDELCYHRPKPPVVNPEAPA